MAFRRTLLVSFLSAMPLFFGAGNVSAGGTALENQKCAALADENEDPKIDYFRIAKRADAYGMSSPFALDGKFNESIAPDVLYVWMDQDRLSRMLAAAAGPSLLPEIGRPYYLWRTPMGSFGYGSVSVRLKLKKGVRFVRIPHIHTIYSDYQARVQELRQNYDLGNTVFVSEIPTAGYHEYLVFNGGSIHSISAGTPEHLAEMNEEARWISQHDRYQDFDLIFKVNPASANSPLSEANLVAPIQFDGRPWSREGLKERVSSMEEMVSQNPEGTILFSNDVPAVRGDHFTSKLKWYWEGAN